MENFVPLRLTAYRFGGACWRGRAVEQGGARRTTGETRVAEWPSSASSMRGFGVETLAEMRDREWRSGIDGRWFLVCLCVRCGAGGKHRTQEGGSGGLQLAG